MHISLQWVDWVLACGLFLLMSWVSSTFFQVRDRAATLGKRFIAGFAGGTAVYALFRMLPPTGASTWQLVSALALLAYAACMFVWAWRTNQTRPFDFVFSNLPPQHISQSGPYGLVRHPFYSAYCTAWLGAAAAANDVLLSGLSAVLIVIYIIAARREERAFGASPLGNTYQSYRANTCMLLPIPSRLRRASNSKQVPLISLTVRMSLTSSSDDERRP